MAILRERVGKKSTMETVQIKEGAQYPRLEEDWDLKWAIGGTVYTVWILDSHEKITLLDKYCCHGTGAVMLTSDQYGKRVAEWHVNDPDFWKLIAKSLPMGDLLVSLRD